MPTNASQSLFSLWSLLLLASSLLVSSLSAQQAPVITGVLSSDLAVNDNSTGAKPFPNIAISDPNSDPLREATITLSPATLGGLKIVTNVEDLGNGSYRITANNTNALETLLRNVEFVPTPNLKAPGSPTDSVTLAVTVTDGTNQSAPSNRTAVITAVNDAPVITPSIQLTIDDDQTNQKIFSTVAIADPDPSAQVTLSISFNPTWGTFANPGGNTFTLTNNSATESIISFSARSASSAQSAIRDLSFTPAANRIAAGTHEVVGFDITASDGTAEDRETQQVRINSINDAPSLSPTAAQNVTVVAGSSVNPFSTISVSDPDVETPTSGNFTATIVMTPDPYGSFSDGFFSAVAGRPGEFQFTGNLSSLQSAIRGARYLAPGSVGSYSAVLTVKDPSGVDSESVTRNINVTQPSPGMTGLLGGQSVNDNATINPFSNASFNNFGGGDRYIEISLNLDEKGGFENLGAFSKRLFPDPPTDPTAPKFVYVMVGNSSAATTAIRGLRFRPTANRNLESFDDAVFTIKVYNVPSPSTATIDPAMTGLSSDQLSLRINPFNDAPTILGTNDDIFITDVEEATPFTQITVADVDRAGEQVQTLNITLVGEDPVTRAPRAGGGILMAPAGSSIDLITIGTAPNITYRLIGKPAEITSQLRSLIFVPEQFRNAINQRETIRFTITSNDGNGGTAQYTQSRVTVTTLSGAPTIDGIPALALQPFAVPNSSANQTKPFESLTLLDVRDNNNPITFSIQLDDSTKGTIVSDDFVLTSPGIYSYSASPALITTALKNLSYAINPSFSFPDNQPGLTTFTLRASDGTNVTTQLYTIFTRKRSTAHIVTSLDDSGPGSLREAVSFASSGDSIVFDFPDANFPITIALEQPIEITQDLRIIGSGVRQLAISGIQQTGLFTVINGATLTLEQLTLRDGAAPSYGGAVSVDIGSRLIARYCEFRQNTAGQYGGAIDVFEGDLQIENCLFAENSVTGSTAESGGAISIFSEIPSTIVNSTFVQNQQANASGLGGGAIYAQNSNVSTFFRCHIRHCTFTDNVDLAGNAHAILSSASGARVHLVNNILASSSSPVINVIGGGRYVSAGGNIATDATRAIYQIGGTNVTLLDHPSDRRSTNPMLKPLAFNFGATATCEPLPGSPAINQAVVMAADITPGTDQRGFWRPIGTGTQRDIGAHEVGEFRRVNLNEIFAAAGAGDDFIEIYNPRDSDQLDMSDIRLWIDGNLVHTFAPRSLLPGSGFAFYPNIDLNSERGRIELRNSLGQLLTAVDYVTTFSENGIILDTTGESINRYPRYEGGFLPHKRVVERVTGISPGVTALSPGDDVDGSELGGGNAPPLAFPSPKDPPSYSVAADQILLPDVLANDIDFDRTDTLKITELMPISPTGVVVNGELQAINSSGQIPLDSLPPGAQSITSQGATVTINPDGRSITYDPRTSAVMIALAKGETITDYWGYTILDYDVTDAAQSRGSDDTKKAANIKKATAWFAVTVVGVNEAPSLQDDVAVTSENHGLRLLANSTLVSSPGYNFGDLSENFQEFDATGAPITLLPAHPAVSVLDNDDDVDSDDDRNSLILGAVHTTAAPADLLVTTSQLGARVVLDIRADRSETNVLYDPRDSAFLNSLRDGEVATDHFYYSVFDRHGARSVAKVSITVTGVNDVPVARNDAGFATFQNVEFDLPHSALLANDTDIDTKEAGPSDTVVVSAVDATSAIGASVRLEGSSVIYDPRNVEAFIKLARNETLTDTFEYRINDGKGGQSTATVTIVVEGVNQAPVAASDLMELRENETDSRTALTGVLANDVDVDINGTQPDDSPWVIAQRGVTTPLGARLDLETDGSFRYDANSAAIDSLREGQVVTEQFPYTVVDNSRTKASDDAFKVFSNGSELQLDVLLNDAVIGSSPTNILGFSANSAGQLVIESTNHSLRSGMLVKIADYEGSGNYNGVHAITAVDRNHFSIDLPFADAPTTSLGTWIPWFRITAVTAASQGAQLEVIDGQSLRYTPTFNFFGYESFSYTIEDGCGGQDVGTVGIEVITPGFNGFVSASDDRYIVGKNASAVTITALSNDGILPGGSAGLNLVSISPNAGATGSLEIINGGTALAYTPAPDFTGTESFAYTVSGGGPSEATAMISFEVVDRDNALNAASDDFVVTTNSSGNLIDVLANDAVLPTYPVNPAIVAINGQTSSVTTIGGGSATIVNQQIRYSAPAAVTHDELEYTIRDATGATTTRTARIRVVSVNPDFFATDNHYLVAAGSGPISLSVLSNDLVVGTPGATPTIMALGIGSNAPPVPQRVSIVNGQAILYTPPTTAATESFTYEIGIGTTERRSARITITTLDSFATLPTAQSDDFKVARRSGPHVLDVLVNDVPYPAAGWNWTIVSTSASSHGGSVEIIDSGRRLRYSPATEFVGAESFSYTIRDLIGNTSVATVHVVVGDMFTSTDHFAVLENSAPILIPVLANDNFLSLGSADYSVDSVTTTSVMGGSVAISGTGPANALTYQPPTNFVGTDQFSYTVLDRSGGAYEAQVVVEVVATNADRDQDVLTIRITGVNDIPVISGLQDWDINDKETVHPFAGFTLVDIDENGEQLQTVSFSYDDTLGTVEAPGMTPQGAGSYSISGTPAEVMTALRAVIFTPFENLALYIDPGQSEVAFALSIDDGYVDPILSESVTVTVTGVNDAPAPQNDLAFTQENQAIRLLADLTLTANPSFNFGDLSQNFLDFNGGTERIALLPPAPTVALLDNDDDVDADDDKSTILIGAVHTTAVPTDLRVTTSALGARIVLDIRANRAETNIVYDPRGSTILNALPAGVSIEDHFYYSVFDRHGARGIAKVTITVTGVNDLPMATDDEGFAVSEDRLLDIDGDSLLPNDTDPDEGEGGGPTESLRITSVSSTSELGGLLSLDVDQQKIRFDPTTIPVFQALARNESIADSFTYTTTDASGGTSTATVRLTVQGINDAPVAAADALPILENETSVVARAQGLMANDVDVDINGTTPDDDPWIIPQRQVVTPLGASLDILPDGSYRYDANSRAIDSLYQGEIATEVFPYIIVDNFRTQAADDKFKVFASSSQVTLPVLANDAVCGTTPTPIIGFSASDDGKLIIQSTNHALRDGLLIRIEGYDGAGSYNGVYAITALDRDTFSVDVPFIDDPADARGTWIPWVEITTVSAPDKGGVVTITEGQSLRYTPTPGFYGKETFTYAIRDGVGGQDLAEVEMEVLRPEYNGFVSTSDDHFLVGMGSPAISVDVLANDGIRPATGTALTVTSVSPLAGAAGSVAITNGGKALSYTPPSDAFFGSESFTYTVVGQDTLTSTATVTFTVVDRTNRLDGADNDFYVVAGSSDNVLDVLANDPVLPAYPVSSQLVAIVGTPQGAASIVNDRLVYTPSAVGVDVFAYTARDASGATVTRTVRVRTVENSPDFVATNDHYIILAGSPEQSLPVLLNDGMVGETSGSIGIINLGLDTNAPPSVDRALIAADGRSIRYTPPTTAGTETFTYETSLGADQDLRRRAATVTITVVESFATAPEAAPDAFHVAKNASAQVLDVLTNDLPIPAAGWNWSVSQVDTPNQGGSAQVLGDGKISYQPAPGFFGVEQFDYEISDEFGRTASSTITIRVGGMMTTPDRFTILENSSPVVMPVLLNDDLLESEAATYVISDVSETSITGASVHVMGTGPNASLRYTPAANFHGEDSFTYTVIDRTGDTKQETVTVLIIPALADRDDSTLTVTITGVNDVPVIAGTENRSITDKQTVKPFENISITDLDEWDDQRQRVTVSFDTTKGSISAPGMSLVSAGTWRAEGTPAAVTATLRAIVFTPFENLIDYIDPGSEDVAFRLTVTDFWIPNPLEHTTLVKVTPVNDAPTLIKPIPNQVVQVNAMPTFVNLLFHFADVDDSVSGGQLTWTITQNSNPSLFTQAAIRASEKQLVLSYAANQPGFSNITVRGTDRGGLFVETTFRVTVEGPPVIQLAPGESNPPAAVLITADGSIRTYRQSFRISNQGSLPVSAFILHITGLDQPVSGISITNAEFSTNENGTLNNFTDDARSNVGVNRLPLSPAAQDIKYNVNIAPSSSVVVHILYRVSTVSSITIRPNIRVSLTTPNPTQPIGTTTMVKNEAGDVILTFNLAANQSYQLQYGCDLTSWMNWSTPIPASSFPRTVQFIDDGSVTRIHPSAAECRFYRLVEVP